MAQKVLIAMGKSPTWWHPFIVTEWKEGDPPAQLRSFTHGGKVYGANTLLSKSGGCTTSLTDEYRMPGEMAKQTVEALIANTSADTTFQIIGWVAVRDIVWTEQSSSLTPWRIY